MIEFLMESPGWALAYLIVIGGTLIGIVKGIVGRDKD